MSEMGELQPGTRIGVSTGWKDRKGSHEAMVIMVDKENGSISIHPPIKGDPQPMLTDFYPTPKVRERFWPDSTANHFVLQRLDVGRVRRIISPSP